MAVNNFYEKSALQVFYEECIHHVLLNLKDAHSMVFESNTEWKCNFCLF